MSLAEDTLTTDVRKRWPGLKGKGDVLNPADLPRLTAQQTAFVEAMVTGQHTLTSAFLLAYPTANKWPRPAVWAAASRLGANGKVSTWLDHAWTAQARAINRSAKGHVYRLEQVFESALRDKAYGAAVQAEKAHAEALGHRANDGEAAVSVTIKTFQSDQGLNPHTIDVSPVDNPADEGN